MFLFSSIIALNIISIWASPSILTLPNKDKIIDSEIESKLESLDKAVKILASNPTYQMLEREFQNQIQSNERMIQKADMIPIYFDNQDSGLEVEYDTSKLILKNKKLTHENKQILKTDLDPISLLPFTISNLPEQLNFFEVPYTDKKLDDSLVETIPVLKNCNFKCKYDKKPICAVNVNNKYSIFENMCDLKTNNCLNPELEWQTVDRNSCKAALHDFYTRLHIYFQNNEEQKEKVVRSKKKFFL